MMRLNGGDSRVFSYQIVPAVMLFGSTGIVAFAQCELEVDCSPCHDITPDDRQDIGQRSSSTVTTVHCVCTVKTVLREMLAICGCWIPLR